MNVKLLKMNANGLFEETGYRTLTCNHVFVIELRENSDVNCILSYFMILIRLYIVITL